MDILLEAFSEKMVEMYIEKSINIVINKANSLPSKNFEETIYRSHQRRINLWCDQLLIKMVFIHEKAYSILLEMSYENNISKVVEKVLAIYLSLTHENKSLDFCKNCDEPFYDKIVPGDVLNNYCANCEVFKMLDARKFLYNPIECNICYIKNLEKCEDEMITYVDMFDVICCKDKIICEDCLEKLRNKCSCGSCDIECPFCKQELKYEEL
jgi:hypothetical protein